MKASIEVHLDSNLVLDSEKERDARRSFARKLVHELTDRQLGVDRLWVGNLFQARSGRTWLSVTLHLDTRSVAATEDEARQLVREFFEDFAARSEARGEWMVASFGVDHFYVPVSESLKQEIAQEIALLRATVAADRERAASR